MTKVKDKYLEDIVNKGYVVHNDGVYGISEVVEMAKELQNARKILKRLKRVSGSRSYQKDDDDKIKYFSEQGAIHKVLNGLPENYISIDHINTEDDYPTVIASIYVLEKE